MIAYASLGALGLALLVTGLPPLRDRRLSRSVLPYVAGGSRPLNPLRSILRSGAGGQDLRERLEAAGLPPDAERFRLEQFQWGIAGVIAVVGAVTAMVSAGTAVEVGATPALAILMFGVGFVGRDRWLARRIERRRSALIDQIPVALDLMTLSVIAGEGIPGATERVAATLGGEVGEEFERVLADIRAGSTTIEALEGLSRRIPDRAVARMVEALCTALERGAPVADVLRSQSDDHRSERRARALEAGGKREILMLVPVVFLILPVVVVFALWPGLVSLDLLVP